MPSDWLKFLDTLIKAPLWFFFAAAVFCDIPMFNISNLVEAGVTSNMKVGSVPLAFIALAATSLFASSAIARSWTVVAKAVQIGWTNMLWAIRVRGLSKTSKLLLALCEETADLWFYYLPRHEEIKQLRDAGVVKAELVSGDGEKWGKFELSSDYLEAFRKRRPKLRRLLRYDHEAAASIRATIRKARVEATGRV